VETGFFTGTDMARLTTRQAEFFGSALGGPVAYTGAAMDDAHRGRGIEMKHFELVAGYLAVSLADAGVPAPVVDQIVAAVAPLADDIVTPAPAI